MTQVKHRKYFPPLIAQLVSINNTAAKFMHAEFESLTPAQVQAREFWVQICKHAVNSARSNKGISQISVEAAGICARVPAASYLLRMKEEGMVIQLPGFVLTENYREVPHYGLTEKGKLFIERWASWKYRTGLKARKQKQA